MADRIQLRRGTEAEWSSNLSEVLSDGEIGIIRISGNQQLIIGDGTSTVEDLLDDTQRFTFYKTSVNKDFYNSLESNSISIGSYGEGNAILSGVGNSIYSSYYTYHNVIVGGINNSISGGNIYNSVILGGFDNSIVANMSSVFILGDTITSVLDRATHVNRLVVTDMPTSSAGLPVNVLYSDGGTIKITTI